MSRWLWRIGLVVLVAAAGLGLAFLLWAADGFATDPAIGPLLDANGPVEIRTEPWLSFEPATPPSVGFIFYPGGKTRPDAYTEVLLPLAEAGYLVVVPKMLLDIALFSPNRATEVIDAYPRIERWVIGGHSVGGVMATAFAIKHRELIDGLVLWASYPAANDDLSGIEMDAISIYGTADQFTTLQDIDNSRAQLPPDTDFVPLLGGDHWQFGSYADAPRNASISRTDQHRLVTAATLEFLDSFAEGIQ